MTKLLLISGSLRDGSTNSATVRTAAALAPAGIEAQIHDGMGRLPHFNPDDGVGLNPEVAALRAAPAAPTPTRACARSSTTPAPRSSRTPASACPSPAPISAPTA